MARLTRRMTAALAGAGLVTVCVLATAAPAQAHNYLVDSTPGVGSTITELPKRFEVTTNDNLLNIGGTGNGFFMEVKGPDGLYYGDGCVTVQGPSILMDAALGPAGEYSLFWQVVSTDGHIVSNDYTFTWEPASDATLSKGSETVPDCHGTVDVSAAPETPADNAPAASDAEVLGDVLWIGGAVVAVGVAAVVTVLLLGRKSHGKPERPERQ